MKHGVLQIQSDRFFGYRTTWFPQGEKVDLGLGGELFHLFYTRLPGVACRDCGLVILRWKDLPVSISKDAFLKKQ